MKKAVLILLLLNCMLNYAQEEIMHTNNSIKYSKDIKYTKKRAFTTNLKEKYSGKDFEYQEEKKEVIKKPMKKTAPLNFGGLAAFFTFMKFIFPFILGGIVVYIILKLYLGSDTKFWKVNHKKNKKVVTKLVYEEDDIEKTDIEALLQNAIDEDNKRLAIRYYYLLVLKKLTEKGIIIYDKDKTNADYLYEINDKLQKNEFSYLAYIYTYIWYGKFTINNDDFLTVSKKYTNFMKTIR